MSSLSRILRFLGSIIDAEDCKVIIVGFLIVWLIVLAFIILAGAAGLAVAIFEEMRGM